MLQRLTLEEIGRRAGVSSATVSRVINNRGNVRGETHERVMQVIHETGFQPNAAARRLAGQQAQLLGLIIPETANILFTDPYFPRLIEGVAEACQSHDYLLTLFLFHAVEEERKLSPRLLQASLIDGVIITATQIGDPLIDQLLEAEIPFVQIGHADSPSVNYVDADNLSGAYMLVSHLIRFGYSRIAIIAGPLTNQAAVERLNGYRNALRDRGLRAAPELIVTADYTETGGYDAMVHLLSLRPEAVFVSSDTMALGALRACRDNGVVVPDEMAVVGYDDLPPARQSEPPLTTVRQPVRRAGALAVETLIDIITHGSVPPRRIILPTELIVRASCGTATRR